MQKNIANWIDITKSPYFFVSFHILLTSQRRPNNNGMNFISNFQKFQFKFLFLLLLCDFCFLFSFLLLYKVLKLLFSSSFIHFYYFLFHVQYIPFELNINDVAKGALSKGKIDNVETSTIMLSRSESKKSIKSPQPTKMKIKIAEQRERSDSVWKLKLKKLASEKWGRIKMRGWWRKREKNVREKKKNHPAMRSWVLNIFYSWLGEQSWQYRILLFLYIDLREKSASRKKESHKTFHIWVINIKHQCFIPFCLPDFFLPLRQFTIAK